MADVKFAKAYTNWTGRAFIRFAQSSTGRTCEIKLRDGRGEIARYTRGEARKLAEAHFAGTCAADCPVTTCRRGGAR